MSLHRLRALGGGTEGKRDLQANLGKGQLLMKSAAFPF
jgi:hypothetical protein